ncbi:MAG: hypothetical protein KDD60_12310, partial [Bdellovibrionales bacterium]|nr:hypothetical protein [Bdellovibrionales bacterium]
YVGQNSENFSKVKIFRNVRKVLDTGDYFLLSNGEYFFSHRKDSLKKISGNRLDLGEVEAAAKSVGYSSPVCFVDGNKIHLVVEEADSDVRDDRLAKLRALLPKYAVPSKVNFSPMHPRTPNGKIDRNQIIKGVRSRNE